MRKALPSKEDIVERTIKDQTEVEILEQRGEFREGLDAGKKIDALQTQEQARLQEIGDRYLGGTAYDRERVLGELRVYLNQTAQGIIETGKRLIAMKEAEKHGEWIILLEEKIGISRATAWRFMAIARKLDKCFTVKHLAIKEAFHHDGAGKLYALLNVPDEELAEFDDTGLFRGATVEDINKMSVNQFRKLIAEKEDWRAKAKQLELELNGKYDTTTRFKKRNEKLEKENANLRRELEEAKKPLPQDAAQALEMLAKHRDDALAAYYFLNQANPQGYPDIVLADLTNTAYFLKDLYSLLANTISNRFDIDAPYPADLLESEERSFNNKYASYLEVPGADA
jgi:hypothetical protein